jgi:hypothetical protein
MADHLISSIRHTTNRFILEMSIKANRISLPADWQGGFIVLQTNGFQLNVVMMWFPVLQLLQPVLSHSTSIDHYLILCTTDKG